MTIEYEEIVKISDDNRVKVVLEWIGEGCSGYYQEDDPDDAPLLRFSVYRRYEAGEKTLPYFLDDESEVLIEDEGWLPVSDGSYCTGIKATTPRAELETTAQLILDLIEDDIRTQHRCKRQLEELSWLGCE